MTTDQPQPRDCCEEFEQAAGLSRRRFLQGMAAASAAAVATPTFGDAFRQTAFGADAGRQRAGRAAACAAASTASAWSCRTATRRTTPPGPPSRSPKASLVAARTRCSGCTRRWRRWSGCGTPASSPPCTPSGCRCRTARTSPPWRRSRTPTPARRSRRGWVNRMIGLDGDRRPVRGGPARHVDRADRCSTGPRPRWPPAGSSDISLVGADAERLGRSAAAAELDLMWAGGEHARAGRRLPLRHPHGRPARPGRRGGLHADSGVDLPDGLAGRATSPTRCRTPPS